MNPPDGRGVTPRPPDRAPAEESVRVVQGARITLFGYPATGARLEVVPRSRRWRVMRALPGVMVLFVATPLLALLPPHAPWAAGGVILGSVLVLRGWRERYTVRTMQGTCPHCGAELFLDPGTPLKKPHHLHCEACNHEPLLEVEPDRTNARAR